MTWIKEPTAQLAPVEVAAVEVAAGWAAATYFAINRRTWRRTGVVS